MKKKEEKIDYKKLWELECEYQKGKSYIIGIRERILWYLHYQNKALKLAFPEMRKRGVDKKKT